MAQDLKTVRVVQVGDDGLPAVVADKIYYLTEEQIKQIDDFVHNGTKPKMDAMEQMKIIAAMMEKQKAKPPIPNSASKMPTKTFDEYFPAPDCWKNKTVDQHRKISGLPYDL